MNCKERIGYGLLQQCLHCGAHLDPGETCDCLREKERERQERYNFLAVGNGGQYEFKELVKGA